MKVVGILAWLFITFNLAGPTLAVETETETSVWIPETVAEYADEYGTIMIVDLENQHAYACVDGVVIADTDCVTGDQYTSPTPTGLYTVWCKRSDFYMMDVYYSAYATFFNGGIAIHDADAWRSEYGGSIYMGSGSHGCVNTPRLFAEIVYNNSDYGTPVYVY
jgi:lipoprotein-anchoring transpeptidase ErfK/SrfK